MQLQSYSSGYLANRNGAEKNIKKCFCKPDVATVICLCLSKFFVKLDSDKMKTPFK